MKVGILGSRGFPSTYGGYETLVRHLARHLGREGHDVTVYCRDRSRQRARVEEGITCVSTWGWDTKRLSTLTFGLTATLDASFRRFDALLVLNVANGYWLPALRLAGIKHAVNTDGLEWERGKWSRLGRAAFRGGAWMTAKTANELICDSEAVGAVWKSRYQRESVFVPYGAPVVRERKTDKLADAGLHRGPYALVVARLAPENNVELTLDAIDLLDDRAPRTVVVGAANFDSPIEARLRDMESKGRVVWIGHVEDQELLEQLWSNCAVYVHGHSVGGTNPALLQALGAGAPTLALDTLFNREVLPAAEQLYGTDHRQLAAAMMTVVGSPERQARMRERGQRIVEERYSWDDVCRRYSDVLARLAAER